MKKFNFSTVGGQALVQSQELVSAIEDVEGRQDIETILNKFEVENWRLWLSRWLVLAYYYPEFEIKKIRKLYNKVKLFHEFTDEDLAQELEWITATLPELIDQLKHYESMAVVHNLKDKNNKLLIKLPLKYEKINDVLKMFKESESGFNVEFEERDKSGKAILIKNIEDYEILYKYPEENLYWVDLKTNFSKEEAEALGHCGQADEGSNLVSLRSLHEKMGQMYFHSHVTLEISEDNYVTQTKATANEPPPEKYKPYVQDFIINFEDIIGTLLSKEEGLAICGNFEDLDFLLDNIKRPFDFVDMFLHLVDEFKDKIEW